MSDPTVSTAPNGPAATERPDRITPAAPDLAASSATEEASDAQRFRLALVPGVLPTSWVRTWRERVRDVPLDLVHTTVAEQERVLAEDRAEAALLRLPVDRDALSAIPLYVETTVLVLPKDHLLTALDEVPPAELADETLLVPGDDVLHWADLPGVPSALPQPATTAEAVELVAAGVGLLAVPQSLARLHHRKDLTYRPLTEAPTSQVALAWPVAHDGDPLVEELIGIVRGRTVNSSRGRGSASTQPAPAADRTGSAPARGTGRGRGTENRSGGDRRGGGRGRGGNTQRGRRGRGR